MQIGVTRLAQRRQVGRNIRPAIAAKDDVVDVQFGIVLDLPPALARVAVAVQDIGFNVVKALLSAVLVAASFDIRVGYLMDVELRQLHLPTRDGQDDLTNRRSRRWLSTLDTDRRREASRMPASPTRLFQRAGR